MDPENFVKVHPQLITDTHSNMTSSTMSEVTETKLTARCCETQDSRKYDKWCKNDSWAQLIVSHDCQQCGECVQRTVEIHCLNVPQVHYTLQHSKCQSNSDSVLIQQSRWSYKSSAAPFHVGNHQIQSLSYNNCQSISLIATLQPESQIANDIQMK